MDEFMVVQRVAPHAWRYFLETHVYRQPPRYEFDVFETFVRSLNLGRNFSYFDAIKKGLRNNYLFYQEMSRLAMESRVGEEINNHAHAFADKDVKRGLAACYIMSNLLNIDGPEIDLTDPEDRKIELSIVATSIIDTVNNIRQPFPMLFEVHEDFLNPLLEGISE